MTTRLDQTAVVSAQATAAEPAWRALVDAARAPYRAAGHFAWHFARGKLTMDPVFRYLFASGQIAPGAQVVDIGCGQGLLASLILACARRGAVWPAGWAEAPAGASVTGIDLMPRDVQRAQAALGDAARFVCADMREVELPPCDVVVILDVLHYVDHAAQDDLLLRVRAALNQHAALRRGPGKLLLRVGDQHDSLGFAISQWVDRVVTRVRGHRAAPTHGRPLSAWIQHLRELGFDVIPRPMSAGTPFANVLLVASLPAPAVAPAPAPATGAQA
jgi:SAM-dependent methyltransferase